MWWRTLTGGCRHWAQFFPLRPVSWSQQVRPVTSQSITFLVMTKSKYNLNIFRHGFTVVFTAWRHADGPEGCGKKGFFFLNKMSFFVLDGHLDRAQGVKYQKVRGMAVWDLGYLVYFRVIISLLVLFLLIEYKKEYLNLIVIQVAKINWSAWW